MRFKYKDNNMEKEAVRAAIVAIKTELEKIEVELAKEPAPAVV